MEGPMKLLITVLSVCQSRVFLDKQALVFSMFFFCYSGNIDICKI